jgi:2',3'-cyclic-nucleotide 2'-phosphodiesterase (5'-nucleotidase family)
MTKPLHKTMAGPRVTRRSLLASLAASLATLATWRPAWAQRRIVADVTFVLFNDFYLMEEQPFPDGKSRGGFARLASIIKAERARARETGRTVIVAHGGDTLSPSIMSGFDRGAHIIALLNMIGVDIFAPGNHEFDFGKAIFLERMGAAKFPLYAANLRDADGSALPGFKDRSILEVNGVRIGLTGIAYDQSPRVSSTEDLTFGAMIESTKAQAALLRREGADFVTAVLHCNRGDAIVLQASGATELLLTGHTHDLFVNFADTSALVESGYDGHYVTCIDAQITVRVHGDGRRATTWWPQFRIIDSAGVTPDAEVAAAVGRFREALIEKMGLIIARTEVALDSRSAIVRTRETAIGNLFTDAMRRLTRADAALINGGGIRAGKVYQPGDTISHGDILSELPFSNRVVVVEVTGRDLRRAIENGLSELPLPAGRFPQVSGIRFSFDVTRPPGSRVVSMEVAGAPLAEDRLYHVAVVDFLARGGDDYTMFRDARRITPDNDSPLLANEIVEYLKQLGVLRTGVEGRIIAL